MNTDETVLNSLFPKNRDNPNNREEFYRELHASLDYDHKKEVQGWRKEFIDYVKWLIWISLSAILLLLLLNGFGYWIHFQLSSPVLISIMTTVLANILAHFFVICKYLFK